MHESVDLGRRALLRGNSNFTHVRTPPWAVAFDRFVDTCTRCGDCISVCPESIIIRGSGGFPAIDFAQGACTFCAACVNACPTGALSSATMPPWRQQALVGDSCLAQRGVYCQNCRDSCAAAAIAFPLSGHACGVPSPRVDVDRCTGCGGCVVTCPVDAIAVVAMAEAT